MAEYVSMKPSTMLNPTPVVLVSCAEKGNPDNRDMVTVAWAGTVNSEPPMVSVSLRKERYSHGLISSSGEFVVNLVDLDKAKELGLTLLPADGLETAPRVDGAPVSLHCKVKQVLELGSHDMFLGEVVSVSVRKDLLDGKDALHLEKANLVAYSHGLYHKLGDVMGFFGWSVARPEVYEKRMSALR